MTKKSTHREIYSTRHCKWMRSIQDLSKNTQRNYRQAIRLYEDFHGQSMDSLIKEALDEQSERVPEHELKIYDRILDFRSNLLDEGRMITGVSNYITRVKTLYKKNRVKVPYLPPANEINANRSQVIKFEDYLTKDEIKKGIVHLSLIQQARMMAMVTGGLSNDECANLRTKEHFIEPLRKYHQKDDDIEALRWLADSDNILWIICIKRGKTGKPFYAIMNPECVQMTAQAKLEEVKPLRYGRVPRELDARLYPTEKNFFGECCRRVNDGLGFGYVGNNTIFTTLDAEGVLTIPKLHFQNFRPYINQRRISRDEFEVFDMGKELKIRFPYPNARIQYDFGGKSRFRPHMFRKFHATSVRGNYHIGDAGLSPSEVDELQGRGMTSVQETYIKANPKKQKLLYCQIINNISLWHKYNWKVIDDDIVLEVVDDEVENQKLKKENEKLKKKLEVSQDVKEDIKILIEDKGIDEVADIVAELLKAT